jgi:uncharacterized ParB-like nuclease family protein
MLKNRAGVMRPTLGRLVLSLVLVAAVPIRTAFDGCHERHEHLRLEAKKLLRAMRVNSPPRYQVGGK